LWASNSGCDLSAKEIRGDASDNGCHLQLPARVRDHTFTRHRRLVTSAELRANRSPRCAAARVPLATTEGGMLEGPTQGQARAAIMAASRLSTNGYLAVTVRAHGGWSRTRRGPVLWQRPAVLHPRVDDHEGDTATVAQMLSLRIKLQGRRFGGPSGNFGRIGIRQHPSQTQLRTESRQLFIKNRGGGSTLLSRIALRSKTVC